MATYRDEWLRQAREFASVRLKGTSVLQFLYDSCRLEDVEIAGDTAIGRKKFDGAAKTVDDADVVLRFQSLYLLARHNHQWRIAGFVGYLPNPMPVASNNAAAETPW